MSDSDDNIDDVLGKSGEAGGDDFGEFGGFSDDKPREDKPVSKGHHFAKVEDAKMADATDAGQRYGAIKNLELRWRIVDGADKKRVIIDRIPLKHQKPETVANARATMAAIRIACGLQSIPNAAALVGQLCQIEVRHRESNGKTYANLGGYKPVPAGYQPPPEDPLDKELPF